MDGASRRHQACGANAELVIESERPSEVRRMRVRKEVGSMTMNQLARWMPLLACWGRAEMGWRRKWVQSDGEVEGAKQGEWLTLNVGHRS